MMAVGAAEALRAPSGPGRGDIRIAGFDGLAATSWPSFQITTMTQPLNQLATAAVGIIVSRLQSGSDRLERQTFGSILAVI